MSVGEGTPRPTCSNCGSAEMVRQYAGGYDWMCYGCSRRFDAAGGFR